MEDGKGESTASNQASNQIEHPIENSTQNREEMSEDERSAAEIERVFGPVDEKQRDVEQL